ncbi:hypothetical protein EYF80_008445 [Liparis tanakae]|uniref:Uncharacterized protein n=1 Tax=Liparis tanakae TaxID=230148 RepID=A0A4Z2ITQ0_9TELE|nr:hypothetical protein EYF80_008445 [Liparis tanakae]
MPDCVVTICDAQRVGMQHCCSYGVLLPSGQGQESTEGRVDESDALRCSMLMSRTCLVSSSMVLILSGSSTEWASVLDSSLLVLPLLVEAGWLPEDSSSSEVIPGIAVVFLPLACLLGGTFTAGGSGAVLQLCAALLVAARPGHVKVDPAHHVLHQGGLRAAFARATVREERCQCCPNTRSACVAAQRAVARPRQGSEQQGQGQLDPCAREESQRRGWALKGGELATSITTASLPIHLVLRMPLRSSSKAGRGN